MNKIPIEFGAIIPLGETKEVSCTILEIFPNKKIEKHYHKKIREIEIILSGEILVNGRIKKEGEILIWEKGANHAHEYKNNSKEIIKVLCISTPKYDPSDTYKI